jgi:ketosteroid isomerase-like protein
MKGLIAVLLALLLGSLVAWFYFAPAGPPSPAEMTEFEIAQIEAEAVQAISETWDAYHTNMTPDWDVEVWLSYWTPEAHLYGPGRDLSATDLAAGFIIQLEEAALTALSLDLEPLETWVHGDVAYQVGRYDETVQFEGQDRVDYANYFFCRWEKQADGAWKLDRFLSGPRDAPEGG